MAPRKEKHINRLTTYYKKLAPLAGLANGTKLPSDISPRLGNRYRRNALALFVVCALGLIPWTIFLAFTLSPDYHTHHWRLAWAGFDVLLFVAIATTAYLGWRRRQAVIVAGLITATLLICDAWFDITLDLGTSDVWSSVASAVFIELPLAVFILRRIYILMMLSIRRANRALGYTDEVRLHKLPMLAFGEDGEETNVH